MEMGLGQGGTMRQEIYEDRNDIECWDQQNTSRCFVHIANSMTWREITGQNPPHPPLTAKEYQTARIPWFDYYRDDLNALEGSQRLAAVKSVAECEKQKGLAAKPEAGIDPQLIIQYGNTRRPEPIREFQEAE